MFFAHPRTLPSKNAPATDRRPVVKSGVKERRHCSSALDASSISEALYWATRELKRLASLARLDARADAHAAHAAAPVNRATMSWIQSVRSSGTGKDNIPITVHESPSQSLGHVPKKADAPGRIRTSDQQLRRLLLYPPELRAPAQLTRFCDSPCLPLEWQTSPCPASRSTVPRDTPRRPSGAAPCQVTIDALDEGVATVAQLPPHRALRHGRITVERLQPRRALRVPCDIGRDVLREPGLSRHAREQLPNVRERPRQPLAPS